MQLPFFLSAFSFKNIYDSQDTREREKGISLTPLYYYHPFHGHLEISRTITGESSPLLIASNRTRSGNHWFASASHLPLSYALLNSLSYTPYTNFRMYPILIALTIILIDYPIQLLFKLEGIF